MPNYPRDEFRPLSSRQGRNKGRGEIESRLNMYSERWVWPEIGANSTQWWNYPCKVPLNVSFMPRIMNDWGKTEAILINIGILLIFEKKLTKQQKQKTIIYVCQVINTSPSSTFSIVVTSELFSCEHNALKVNNETSHLFFLICLKLIQKTQFIQS